MPPTPQSFRHTGLGNQKKPKDWESPPPLPAPGTPEFESWAATPQRDTSGVNSGMVGHTHKERNASAPDVNPHRINLDEHGAGVDADVAAMHAAHEDIANDEQFGAHKPEPAKTKLGGGEIDKGGIADFQAKLLADRASRGVPANGDYAQKKSAWEAAGGESSSGTPEEANAMLKAHRNAVSAKPRASDAKTPRAAEKAEPRPAKSPAAAAPAPAVDKEAAPASVKPGKPVEKKEEPARQEPQPASTPDVSASSPSAPAPGKLTRIGGNFAPRSTPNSISIPSNAAGTKFTVHKAVSEGSEAPSPAPAAEKKSRFVDPGDKSVSSVPVSPPLAATKPAPPSTAIEPRKVSPAPVTARSARQAPPTAAASKVIGGGNKPQPAVSSPSATRQSPTPVSPPTQSARSAPKSGGTGGGWGDVHHHIHNYYGSTHVGDQYVNHGGVQNIGGTMSIGQSGGSTGGGTGHTGSGGGPRGGSPRSGSGRASTPQYGKPTLGQAVAHTVLNSTVNGKSLNDVAHAATGMHVEQHDTQGRRIGDPHSDAHKMANVHHAEGHHNAANAYHEHEAMRSGRLGQQFTP
jgi:hypothetical protein